MLSDPTIVKLIIMGLVGTNVVLLAAVIYLAFKKNTYYVDADGNDVGTTRKPQVKKVVQATPIAPKPEPMQQPKQNVEDSLAATTVLTDLERPVTPVSPAIKPVKVDSLDTPIREKNNDDSATLFEEIFSTTNLDEADPKILVTIKVAGQTKDHTISKLPCLIGREAASCDLVINEPAISRKHARILIESDTFYLADVSEHNGTYLNGIKLPPLGKARIHEGDHINLGRAEIVINQIID